MNQNRNNSIKIILFLIIGLFLLSSCTQDALDSDQLVNDGEDKNISGVMSKIRPDGPLHDPTIDEPLHDPTIDESVLDNLKIEPITISGVDAEGLSFIQYYKLDALDIDFKIPPYDLPLEESEISNYADFSEKINLNEEALSLLNKNGFVVIKNPFSGSSEYITSPYDILKQREVPLFITTDSLLHLYHIQFDETLRRVEENEFFDAIWEVDKDLLEKSIENYNGASGDLKEAAKKNVAYFSVALSLLQPDEEQVLGCEDNDWECNGRANAFFSGEEQEKYTFSVPDFVKDIVDEELELIDKHSGFGDSPIFDYKEDYSQYLPRGHYTRSEKLKNYFKAFMWHGRITMLLKGDLISDPGSDRKAKIQTMSASLIASAFAENKGIMDKWDMMYSVTAFYVGLSDDLGPYEYIESLNSVFGNSFNPYELDDETVGKLKAKLAEYDAPKIYGGTGACEVEPPFTPEQAEECLDKTKGFRLMGQRFIPDSYMFSNLVFGKIQAYSGDKDCAEVFTCGNIPNFGEGRAFPRGLDVMALLGSSRAKELLSESDDDKYEKYDEKFKELEKEFNEFSVEEWNKNLYWAWLYSLKPLLDDFGEGYPTFMQTKFWQDKELTTALASWAELRHDTILYAKQSYTMFATKSSGPMKIPKVVGYVEPVPEFYNRLLALTRMTTKGLGEMEVLDSTSKSRLEKLEEILERLIQISKDELENKALTQEDYDFIKNFGSSLKGVIADVESNAQKTTIIADVHTDGNSKQVLEEGVGYVDLIVVAYKLPDDRIQIGAGPVMTHYEFKHPMSDRLTDEKWREMLESEPPEKPEWTNSFMQ